MLHQEYLDYNFGFQRIHHLREVLEGFFYIQFIDVTQLSKVQ